MHWSARQIGFLLRLMRFTRRCWSHANTFCICDFPRRRIHWWICVHLCTWLHTWMCQFHCLLRRARSCWACADTHWKSPMKKDVHLILLPQERPTVRPGHHHLTRARRGAVRGAGAGVAWLVRSFVRCDGQFLGQVQEVWKVPVVSVHLFDMCRCPKIFWSGGHLRFQVNAMWCISETECAIQISAVVWENWIVAAGVQDVKHLKDIRDTAGVAWNSTTFVFEKDAQSILQWIHSLCNQFRFSCNMSVAQCLHIWCWTVFLLFLIWVIVTLRLAIWYKVLRSSLLYKRSVKA